MAKVSKIEGVLNDLYWFHVDGDNDVLYMRLIDERQTETYGDENDDGIFLMRRESDDRVVGFTIIGWQQRFPDHDVTSQVAMLEQAEMLLEAA